MESVSAKNPVRIGRRFRSQSEKTPEMAKGLSKGEWDAIGGRKEIQIAVSQNFRPCSCHAPRGHRHLSPLSANLGEP